LIQKFREAAMRKFGYGRGSLSVAAREAISKWLEGEGLKRGKEGFEEVVKEVAGLWRGEGGYKYVRKLRGESERRFERLKI